MKRKMNGRFVSTEMIAMHFGCHQNTVRRWPLEGCPHLRCGRVYRFELPAVQQWLEERTKDVEQRAA